MFRLVTYAILAYAVYLIYRFIRNLGRAVRPPDRPPEPRLTGTMVKDEACGTYIPKEGAIRDLIDGEERFFARRNAGADSSRRGRRPAEALRNHPTLTLEPFWFPPELGGAPPPDVRLWAIPPLEFFGNANAHPGEGKQRN